MESKFPVIADQFQAAGTFVQKSANNAAWPNTLLTETVYSPVAGSSGGYLYLRRMRLTRTRNLALILFYRFGYKKGKVLFGHSIIAGQLIIYHFEVVKAYIYTMSNKELGTACMIQPRVWH